MPARLVFLLFILTSILEASEFQIRYGFGVPKSGSMLAVKYGSLAIQNKLSEYLIEKYEVGGWFDSNMIRGSSIFAGYSIGSRVHFKWFFIEALGGGVINSKPTNFQPSPFLFMLDIGIGVIDTHNKLIGITYKHLSNGNLVRPNGGRDALQLLIGIPF